jgi:hypothetical protein
LESKAQECEKALQSSKLEMRALEQKLETLEKINVQLQVYYSNVDEVDRKQIDPHIPRWTPDPAINP